ncbi:MAG: Dipeptide transport system permease protein DppC, partial [uncultured Thermomicrobiales bacterium]
GAVAATDAGGAAAATAPCGPSRRGDRAGGGAPGGRRTAHARERRRPGRAAAAQPVGGRLAAADPEQAGGDRPRGRRLVHRDRGARAGAGAVRAVGGRRLPVDPHRAELDLAARARPERAGHLQPPPLRSARLPRRRRPLPGAGAADRDPGRRPRRLLRRPGRQHPDALGRRRLRHPPAAVGADLRQSLRAGAGQHLHRDRTRRLGDGGEAGARPVPGPAGAGVRQRGARLRLDGVADHAPPPAAQQPDTDHRGAHLRHPDCDLHRGGALLRRGRHPAAASELGADGRRRQPARLHPDRSLHAGRAGGGDRPDHAWLHLPRRWAARRARRPGERL